jgi:hypothetical protein
MALKRAVQVTMREMVGPEIWYRIEHNHGWFKLPYDGVIGELFEGALHHWSATPKTTIHAEATVRIPLSELLRLQHLASSSRQSDRPASLVRAPGQSHRGRTT